MRKTFTLLIALFALCAGMWADPVTHQQQVGDYWYTFYDEYGFASLIKLPGSGDYVSYSVSGDITIPGTVNDDNADYAVSIGYEAFVGCSDITSVTVEEGVDFISNFAFMGCTNLTTATLPSTITGFGNQVFGFSGLTSVTIRATIPADISENDPFAGADALAHIYVPAAKVDDYKEAWTSYASKIEAIPSGPTTTIKWEKSDIINLGDLVCNNVDQTETANAIDGITFSITKTSAGETCKIYNQGDLWITNCGEATFTSTVGNITKIVITHSDKWNTAASTGWIHDDEAKTFTWQGTPSSAVTISGNIDFVISSIEFTLEAEEEPEPDVPTHLVSTVIWETADLATVNVEMGYNSTGQSQNIKNIIVTNNAVYTAGQYCHFNTANGQLNDADWPDFSMRDGGSLTFAPAEGKLTRIVITCDDIYPSNLAAGSGWVWDGSSKLTWSDENGATSVVLAGDGSSTSFSSGPIRRIEFTLAADPDAQGDVKWDKSELEDISLLAYPGTGSTNQTIDGIVATATASENGDYCHFLYDSDNDKVTMTVSGNGTLTFAPETGRLTRIVIAGIVDSDNTNLPDESGWTPSANKLIWSGDASFSVDLANASVDHITYVAFTIDDSDPNDTREVPELSFRNGEYALTEATIVRDCHDEIFEPGTYYLPSTEYYLYVNNGVMYYQDQPFTDWATPTYKGLTMTYSVPNNDVITLTKTSGNSFEFTVNGIGDAVVTAHTDGNEDYKPASTTFTIHVEEGKAATKECVLKFIGGPNAGQFVPEDYKFEMETGEEFPWSWFELREKDYPDYVYAPSFTIWGSRNYYVACLNEDSKLRALTAGDDMFTIRYARCEGGDMNNEYRLIEFPVHIKPTEIALTTSVNFASDPSSNSSIANNATYDPTTHQVQIGEVISDEKVQGALTCYAFGHEGWDENLKNTISFELPQGNGSLTVNGTVQEGCVLKVKIRGENGVHSFTPTQVSAGEATVNYDVPNQTAVVIYISTNGSSPAPKRAPAAKKDAPLAALTALSLTPTYPISANVDPDHAGVYYSTHYNEMQKYILPAGTEAYVATISGSDMNLTKVVNAGEVLPANTAVILKSTSASVVLTPTDAAAVTVSAPNQLKGTDSEKAAPENCYVLSGHSTDYSVTGVGFYEFSGTIPAHKAYLINSGTGAPKRMRFIFNNEQQATGIDNAAEALKSEKRIENGQLIIIKNGVRYNAQGQVVK